jgi:hypothetical protein
VRSECNGLLAALLNVKMEGRDSINAGKRTNKDVPRDYNFYDFLDWIIKQYMYPTREAAHHQAGNIHVLLC